MADVAYWPLSRMGILYLRSRVHRFESCRGRHLYLARDKFAVLLQRRLTAKPHLQRISAQESITAKPTPGLISKARTVPR